MEALIKAKEKRRRAVEILGWGRSTLWRKVKHYGLLLAASTEAASKEEGS
ncbi:hypothetical protein [Desulfosoma caldarium]